MPFSPPCAAPPGDQLHHLAQSALCEPSRRHSSGPCGPLGGERVPQPVARASSASRSCSRSPLLLQLSRHDSADALLLLLDRACDLRQVARPLPRWSHVVTDHEDDDSNSTRLTSGVMLNLCFDSPLRPPTPIAIGASWWSGDSLGGLGGRSRRRPRRACRDHVEELVRRPLRCRRPRASTRGLERRCTHDGHRDGDQ